MAELQINKRLTIRRPRRTICKRFARYLANLFAIECKHEDVALAAVAVGLERDQLAVGRDRRIVVVVPPERKLLRFAALDGEAKQLAEHRKDQPFAIRRHRHIRRRDLRGLELYRAPTIG